MYKYSKNEFLKNSKNFEILENLSGLQSIYPKLM